MARRPKLSAKLVGIQIFALVVALASIGATLLVSWRLEGSAAAINDAGSLRMRTYRLAYIAQVDTFEGYYSYTAPSPFVQLQVTPAEPLSIGLRGEVRPMTFGPNSKANTEDGKRLQDTRYGVKGDVKYRLREGLSVVAEASWTKRDTNFPDYVPGVYPSATSLYDIKWDYTNTMVTAGVEWKP